MKKRIMLILFAVLLVFTLVGTPALAKEEDKDAQGQPFQELRDAIDEAVAQMEQLIGEVQEELEGLISEVELGVEQMVEDAILALEAQLANLQAQLDDEEAARIAGDQAVASAAQAANDALQTLLETAIAQGDAATASAAQDANDALQALLEADIAAEEAARIAADNALQNSINSEASTRYYKDNSLQAQINSIVIPTFGARSYKPPNIGHNAATDGIVTAWVGGTDSSHYDTPIDILGIVGFDTVAFERSESSKDRLSITFPVRKGETWRVICAYTYTFDIRVIWTPVGN